MWGLYHFLKMLNNVPDAWKKHTKFAILQDYGKSLQGSKERKKKSKTSFLKVMNINVAKLAGLIKKNYLL